MNYHNNYTLCFIKEKEKNDKKRKEVIKIAQANGLTRVQKSVFVGDVNKRRIDLLTNASKKVIDKNTDSIFIFPIAQDDYDKLVMIGRNFDRSFISNKKGAMII